MAGRELQACPSLSESFTPDHKPLMGEAPELRGFFLGCGFNSAGKRGQQCVPDSLASLQVKTANWAFPSVLRAPPPTPGWGAGPGSTAALTGVEMGQACREGVRSR